MRVTEAEKGQFSRMRDVSDLRTQFQCEYRLHLEQKFGNSHSSASTMGTELHRLVSKKPNNRKQQKNDNRWIPLIIIILTLVAGFLWIFW